MVRRRRARPAGVTGLGARRAKDSRDPVATPPAAAPRFWLAFVRSGARTRRFLKRPGLHALAAARYTPGRPHASIQAIQMPTDTVLRKLAGMVCERIRRHGERPASMCGRPFLRKVDPKYIAYRRVRAWRAWAARAVIRKTAGRIGCHPSRLDDRIDQAPWKRGKVPVERP